MALFHAVDTNNIEEVQRLILEGNHLDELNGSFHRAVMRENLEMCKILLAAGADINKKSAYNETAYDIAVRHNNARISDFLKYHTLK
jgi:ankyrin repeat protein